MKKIIALACLASITACGEEPATETPEEVAAPAERSMVGVYEETTADGELMVTRMEQDGSYKELVNEVLQESGTWTDDGETICFDPTGEDTPARCFTISEIADDGTFEATLVGETDSITVKKVS